MATQADLVGRVVQVIGAVVDIEFERHLPEIEVLVRASGLPFHVEDAGHPGMGDSIAAGVRATIDAEWIGRWMSALRVWVLKLPPAWPMPNRIAFGPRENSTRSML